MNFKKGTLLFEITNACNLRCIHCYKENLGGNDLTLAQIKIILKKISAFGLNNLILTGGEPFLRKDLFKIIDYAIKCNIEDIVINTNGTLLDKPQIINEINDRLDIITTIPVSLDGSKSETHDFIRGKGQFIQLMKLLENNSLSDLPIGLNITIGKWNFTDLDNFFVIYDKLDALDINFGIFIPLGLGKQLMDQLLSPDQYRSLIQIAIQKKEAGYKVELCSLPYSNVFVKDISGNCCNIFTEFITITAQGNIVPCILYDFNCGSILELELDEILSSPLAQLLSNPKKLQKKMTGYCRNCLKFELCKGGCKLLTYALKGTIYSSDPLCPLTLEEKK